MKQEKAIDIAWEGSALTELESEADAAQSEAEEVKVTMTSHICSQNVPLSGHCTYQDIAIHVQHWV